MEILNGIYEKRTDWLKFGPKEDRRVVEIELTEKAKVTGMVMQEIIRNSLMHLFESSDEHDLGIFVLYNLLWKGHHHT